MTTEHSSRPGTAPPRAVQDSKPSRVVSLSAPANRGYLGDHPGSIPTCSACSSVLVIVCSRAASGLCRSQRFQRGASDRSERGATEGPVARTCRIPCRPRLWFGASSSAPGADSGGSLRRPLSGTAYQSGSSTTRGLPYGNDHTRRKPNPACENRIPIKSPCQAGLSVSPSERGS